ncbi:MAG: NADH-ubiquinone oxidoreductase-F iron-sulfur binding region domain-containing protein [Saprospiraceae bacterium]
MSKNLSWLSSRQGLVSSFFEQLQKGAEATGAPDKAYLQQLAQSSLMGEANTLGAASFYDFLKPENKGKKAYICNGSACLLAGQQDTVKKALQPFFAESEIGEMTCLGRCHENAAFHINGTNFSGTAITHLPEILKSPDQRFSGDSYASGVFAQKAVLLQPNTPLRQYYQLWKKCLAQSSEAILAEVLAANLRGRGGAGFPIGLKLEACRQAKGAQKYIICNADEGDPGSYSDRFLLEEHPHAILFGMLVCGYITGADQGILYIRGEYPEAIQKIKKAIHDFEDLAMATSYRFDFKVVKGSGSYICGEETALISSIEGQRPEVRLRPPFPTESGLFNCPTLVNNVETLANLHFLLENGAAAYRKLGTASSSGTKLVCLDSFFNRPGVYEVEFGTPLSTIIEQLGEGFKAPVKALHIGGPLGGLVPRDLWSQLTLDFEAFSQKGFQLGHGSFLSIPESFPIIRYLEHLFAFTAHESCGKCFPCRLGSQRGMEILQQAQHQGDQIDRALFDDLLETLEIGSLCGLGSGLPVPVRNILTYFSEELKPYFL